MKQPELGSRLTGLRKEKSLTQEELAAKSHVSVRTIQRIEAGEVLPRMSTVRILWEALGQSLESFSTQQTKTMETKAYSPKNPDRNILLVAAIAGAFYLVLEIILSGMDVAWIFSEKDWEMWTVTIYTVLSVTMVAAYVLFIRGFIALSNVFENPLLKIGCYLMIVAVAGVSVMDITFTINQPDEDVDMWFAYIPAAILMGATSLLFGVALIRLQDGMGELSRVAGILEILIGCSLVTVVLFFFSFVIMVPAVVVEILVLYKGYEYLSKSEANAITP